MYVVEYISRTERHGSIGNVLQTPAVGFIIQNCWGFTAPMTSIMQENSDRLPAEMERAELEAVVETLGRSSRLANLLRYIGEKYFRGEIDQISEYGIATEVFGRSKATFNAGEDAIARVEAHRLRKRLKEFYEGAGKGRSVELSISLGTYIPIFSRRAVEAPSPKDTLAPAEEQNAALPEPEAASPRPANQEPNLPAAVLERKKHRIVLYALLGILLACLAIIGFNLILRSHRAALGAAASGSSAAAVPARQLGPLALAAVPLRLLAGYSGKPQTDSAGAVWEADRYVHGGGAWRRPEASIAGTSDPLIFRQWRTGDFVYDIPLRPGIYELHLYFVTADRSSDSFSTFSVAINGNLVLRGFDINSDALGDNIADERVFRDVSPGNDGMLHISFASERGAPQLNALEVLPGMPHKQLPIRLVTQTTSFTDHNGQFWHPDTYYMNGRLSEPQKQIAGSLDPDLFAAERYGHFTYSIPVDTRDQYTLLLHFAEFYFGPQAPGGNGAGSRVFRVMCNGQTLLDNFDIYKEAGSFHALTKAFYHIKASPQGKLNLTFEPIVNNATVSGIEVLDEAQ